MKIDNNDIWTERRKSILSNLENVDPNLAHFYQCAVDEIDDYTIDSTAKAQLSSISHCIRELINSLPDALNDGEAAFPTNVDLNKSQKALLTQLSSIPRFITDRNDDQSYIPIPLALADAINAYRDSNDNATENRRLYDSFTVTGEFDTQNPALYPWTNSRHWFMSFTHYDRGAERKIPEKQELLRRLEAFETILTLRFGDFFAIEEDLEMVLKKANQVNESGEYFAPSYEDIQNVLSSIASVHLRHRFYLNLNNPLWVSVLKQRGAFSAPPKIDASNGSFLDWAEADYLSRMAALSPQAVCEVLIEILDTDNPYIRGKIIEAAEHLPIRESIALAGGITKWAKDAAPAKSNAWSPRTISGLIVKLLSGGREGYREAIKMFQAFFTPFSGETSTMWSQEPKAIVPDYAYREELYNVMNALRPDKHFGLLNGLMNHYLSESYHSDTLTDLCWVWRPSIRLQEEDSSCIIGNALIDALLDTLSYQVESDVRKFEKSLFGDSLVLRRISMHVLTLKMSC